MVTTNNNSVVKSDSLSSPRSAASALNNNSSPLSSKTVGNNKTCNWVFENGEVCGKTFSKSYNLVVHMRMHEDVRPFCCSLCDQTFRQKAHLQVSIISDFEKLDFTCITPDLGGTVKTMIKNSPLYTEIILHYVLLRI